MYKRQELALSEFDKLDHLPNRVLLCGGGSSLDALVDTLNSSQWYGQLPFTRKPVVQYIRPEQVMGIVDKTGDVTDHTFVTAMGLLRVGADTVQQQDAPASTTKTSSPKGSFKERLDRMLRV